MIRILVPIDFTKVSFSAFNYAIHLAESMKAEITVFHVINGSFSTADSMFLDTMDAAYDAANKRLQVFVQEYSTKMEYTKFEVKVKTEVRFGVAGFTIADYANDQGFDYVVAGTRDSHSLIERVLGTTSTIVTKMVKSPVILIHENTRWIKPTKVIYTIDDSTDFDESIDKYISFNQFFKAATDFIHIKVNDINIDSTRDAVIKEVFKKKEPDFAFDIKNIYGGDIVQSIIDYSIFEKADMLVLVHRKRNFLNSFFNRSLSLQTAEGIHLPVMILEENPPVDVKNV
ncbi:MAG: universal stress protein [Saprospiraceae bacterium]|nr:universal stress protein [Saprospiraceae bacterium]